MKNIFILSMVLFSVFTVQAQLNPDNVPFFFNEDTVPRIDIIINSDSLKMLLEDMSSDHEYKAQFIYNNFNDIPDTLNDVGFRIRGNVSRMDNKKSFKVSVNTFVPGRKFMGLEKIDLKATGDASYVRPKLCWYMFRKMGLPSIWLNHVMLYINNELWGVYTNVEHIDEVFIKNRYGNNNGNLYKCRNPAILKYISDNLDDYKMEKVYYVDRNIRVYELKTNTDKDDYTDLMELTKVLANYEDENFIELIDDKINIINLLKFFALEVYLGHWDSYSFHGNNYYLYHNTSTNKFEYISYDMDLTMGISFGLDNISTHNIYKFSNVDSLSPLKTRILAIPEYRDVYSFYLKRLVKQFPPDTLRELAGQIQHFIAPFVKQDPFFNYTLEDFYGSLDNPFGMSRWGIIEYFNLRYNSIIGQLDNTNITPVISGVNYNDVAVNDPVKISCIVDDDDLKPEVKLHYQFNSGDFIEETMNLISEDTLLGIGYYVIVLDAMESTGQINFYLEATDVNGHTRRLPYINNHTIVVYPATSNLRINEILAGNSKCMTDEFGQHEDWIEIINADTIPISLGNKYLSDSYDNANEWKLPAIELQPGEIAWFWADDEANQGVNHADFKLSKDGETVYLFEKQNDVFLLLDSLNYPEQKKNISYGLLPGENRAGELEFITPGFANDTRGLAYMTFDAKMKYMIDNGDFDASTNTVDVVGNFNNWMGSGTFFDMNNDSTYTRTIYDLMVGETIEYRFRIDENDHLLEFATIPGSSAHRIYTVQEGCNIQKHYFNEISVNVPQLLSKDGINIYPNPVNDYLQVQSPQLINYITISDINGKSILHVDVNGKMSVNLNTGEWKSGVYFIKIVAQSSGLYIEKIIKL